MTTLLDELSRLIIALEDGKIEYAVCDELPMAVHGFVRATIDIDILIRPESFEKAFEVAAKKRF
jgi:hypothetical protein